MRQKRKVIHIELLDPAPGHKRHQYFGSVAAIYESLSKDDVGIAKESLWNALKSGEYRNKMAIIRHGEIISKKTNRGRK